MFHVKQRKQKIGSQRQKTADDTKTAMALAELNESPARINWSEAEVSNRGQACVNNG